MIRKTISCFIMLVCLMGTSSITSATIIAHAANNPGHNGPIVGHVSGKPIPLGHGLEAYPVISDKAPNTTVGYEVCFYSTPNILCINNYYDLCNFDNPIDAYHYLSSVPANQIVEFWGGFNGIGLAMNFYDCSRYFAPDSTAGWKIYLKGTTITGWNSWMTWYTATCDGSSNGFANDNNDYFLTMPNGQSAQMWANPTFDGGNSCSEQFPVSG